jgi:hypothetical protein
MSDDPPVRFLRRDFETTLAPERWAVSKKADAMLS